MDEKPQIHALDRSQPILPMLPGVPERATHDYKRSGTSSLFAALDIASANVIGSLHARHRTVEFKKFLVQIDTAVPADLDVHLILDNYTTHKTGSASLARGAPTVPSSLHPDRSVVAGPRRALARRAHQQKAQATSPQIRPRTQHRHPPMDRDLERRPPPLRVDKDSRPNPRQPHTLLPTNY